MATRRKYVNNIYLVINYVTNHIRLEYKPAQPLVIARVTDPSTGHKQLWDMSRPLEYNCELEVFDYDSKEGQSTFWHSSAHLLGQAIEEHYKNIQLCDGPALSSEDQHGGGFFYEFQLGDKNMSVNAEDYANIEEIVRRAVKKGHPFERMLVSKEFAMKMFGYNPFKVDLLNHIPADEPITVYKSGTFIDLCRGPHISNTAIVKAFNVTKTSSAYYLGDPNGLPLQRMYGISFPDKNMLADWKRIREEIQKRDHRVVGKSQKLLMFSSLSPGRYASQLQYNYSRPFAVHSFYRTVHASTTNWLNSCATNI